MSFFSKQVFINSISQEVGKILEFVKDETTKEFRAQGHELTGALINTMTEEIIEIERGVKAILWVNEYYVYTDQGVPAERIPYDPGSGKQTSKYIDALTKYFQLRTGAPENVAKGYAFGLARKQKQQGSPVDNGISKYSKTGERTGWFTGTIEKNESKIAAGVSSIFTQTMVKVIEEMNGRIKGSIQIVF